MQRTIRIQLQPDAETIKVLTQTIEQYTWSFNAVCRLGWDNKVTHGVALHKERYYNHKARIGLPSQLICVARVKATEALKSANKLVKQKKTVTCPDSKRCTIRYDARSYTVWFDRAVFSDRVSARKQQHSEVTILAIGGRSKLSITIAEYYRAFLSWRNTSTDLIRDRSGRWWLHIVMENDNPNIRPTNETVGVDLSIVSPATDCRGTFYGDKHWKQVADKIFQLRRRLQSKGIKSAIRHLKKLSSRQARFRRDCDHVLSKRLVQSVGKGATIVFEDRTSSRFANTNIRGRAHARKFQRHRLHGWSFAQFQTFVTYKAEAKGIAIGFVDPRFTSAKCSCCGHIERGNRPTQKDFKCKKCSFEILAAHNAAINIRENFLKLRSFGQ